MRIAHVVTAVSPDGAFGGPTRVALNEARELIARGHDVIVLAAGVGWDGATPTVVDGVPVALFPARKLFPYPGYGALHSRALVDDLKQHLTEFDVVHFHLARDFVLLPAALAAVSAGVPFVVQSHGMIRQTRNPLLRLLDRWTARILRAARAVYALTDDEAADLANIAGMSGNVHVLPNGIPELSGVSPIGEFRPGTIPVDVLFLARLHERKRPLTFVRAAQVLAAKLPGATFSLVGPDDGQGDAVEAAIREAGLAQLRYEGALPPSDTAARMARADIYVLPAVDEPFGMTVVEAMQLGLPVVVTETCALAERISESGAGLVVDSSVESLAEAVLTLSTDSALRQRMGNAGRELVRRHFSMENVVETLEAAYSTAS